MGSNGNRDPANMKRQNLLLCSNNKEISENIFSEQMISECTKTMQGQNPSHLTLMQYQAMSQEQKSHIINRVRQWALKARECMPSEDQGLFCLVAAHLLRNAHRYFSMETPSDLQLHTLTSKSVAESTKMKLIDECQQANKKLRVIGDLKCKKRLMEQKKLVDALKEEYHTYRNMSVMSGVSLKTVHKWCSVPKSKIHKSTELARL